MYYIMNFCVLKLVFIIVVEDYAVLVKETHNRRLPSRTLEEINDDIEEPILYLGSASIQE